MPRAVPSAATRSAARGLVALALAMMATLAGAADGTDAGATVADAALAAPWRTAFALSVTRRWAPPPDEQQHYAALARQALQAASVTLLRPQFLLVVDRQPQVQALLLYLADPDPARWSWIGATPVATGRPGGFEHFLTPLGVFLHSPANPDFRAEGTRNELGILGYGAKGLRVFDFGWVPGERTWGAGGTSPMRLQLHATDPGLLEPLLGERHSKGCVRVPASLNRFLDHNGVLDADYDEAQVRGERFWVFGNSPPLANPSAGRWLVVVESERSARPAWAPSPNPPPAARPPAARPPAARPRAAARRQGPGVC